MFPSVSLTEVCFYACGCDSEAHRGQTNKLNRNSLDFSVISDNCTVHEESYGCIISPHLAKTAEGML